MNIYVVISGILFTFVLLTIISFSIEGQLGIASTRLTTAATQEEVSTLNVANTVGFLDIDYVIVGTEYICYSGKTPTTLTGLTRGCHDTEALPHSANSRVYNELTGTMNQMVGFNIAEAMSSSGPIRVPIMLATTVPRAFAEIITWDYVFLEGTLWGFPLGAVKMVFLYPLSGAFMIGLTILLVSVFMGIARIF